MQIIFRFSSFIVYKFKKCDTINTSNKTEFMMKVNKAKIRRDIAAKLAKQFIDSGEKYSCIAAVFVLRKEALDEAKNLLNKGINLSKSNYPFAFAGLMADMFLMDAAKLVHAHNYPIEFVEAK